jgi:hypothetical protein
MTQESSRIRSQQASRSPDYEVGVRTPPACSIGISGRGKEHAGGVRTHVMQKTHFIRCAVVALFLLPSVCLAQDDRRLIDKNRIPAEAETVEGFVPAGWKIDAQVTGDLNADSLPDYALKLVEDKPAKDEEGVATERQRALVIVLRKQGGKLSRAAVADKLLQCTRCGGAFYGVSESPANVQIEKGSIVVDQDHGSRNLTNTTYRFRYDATKAQFILTGFDYADADRATASVVSESTNYLTGVRIVTRGKGNRDVKSRSTIPVKKVSLEEVDSEKFEAAAAKRLGL